jgi:hypothetical protein
MSYLSDMKFHHFFMANIGHQIACESRVWCRHTHDESRVLVTYMRRHEKGILVACRMETDRRIRLDFIHNNTGNVLHVSVYNQNNHTGFLFDKKNHYHFSVIGDGDMRIENCNGV